MSVLTPAHCKQQLLWLGLGAAGSMAINITIQKTVCQTTRPFSKTTVGILLGPTTFLVKGFWGGLQYQAWIPSHEAGLKSNLNALVCVTMFLWTSWLHVYISIIVKNTSEMHMSGSRTCRQELRTQKRFFIDTGRMFTKSYQFMVWTH